MRFLDDCKHISDINLLVEIFKEYQHFATNTSNEDELYYVQIGSCSNSCHNKATLQLHPVIGHHTLTFLYN
jgi:hypothetical protein